MNVLVKYEAACRAVSEALTVDEAKNILDKTIALQAYARQAQNHDFEADALEIRMRATRHIDQLREAQKQTIGLAEGGEQYKTTGLSKNPAVPTLAAAGIDKNLAHRARGLGALSEQDFEDAVVTARKNMNSVVKTATKGKQRDLREAELGRRIKALPVTLYGVADPAWRFEPYRRDNAHARPLEARPTAGPVGSTLPSNRKCFAREQVCALPRRDRSSQDPLTTS